MFKFETHLTTIYCEDLRHEVGGKITLVGVYNNICGVESFPVTLPKIAVMLRLVGPADSFPKSIGFKAWLNEEQVAEVPLSAPAARAGASSLMGHIDEAAEAVPAELQFSGKFTSLTSFMIFAPLHVEKPSTLRVRAYGPDGEEYPAPSLIFLTNEALSGE
jgi:hypothetical protein